MVVMIVCVHACVSQPSAALDRVDSAQQGGWSLGLRDRCEAQHVDAQDSEKD